MLRRGSRAAPLQPQWPKAHQELAVQPDGRPGVFETRGTIPEQQLCSLGVAQKACTEGSGRVLKINVKLAENVGVRPVKGKFQGCLLGRDATFRWVDARPARGL